MTYRTTAENYLLEPRLLDDYWRFHAANAPNWKHGTSPGEQDIGGWMRQAATDITFYQAVRWSLASMKPSARWPEVPTTWTGGSGSLPNSLDEELCLESARQLLAEFNAQSALVSAEAFMSVYATFLQRFRSNGFFDLFQYLVWFQGKDVAKAMQRLRPNSISLGHFFRWSVNHFDWHQHPDLEQFAALLST